MIGNCFDCLVEIDGETNLQACLVTVRDGMRIRSHSGSRLGDSKGRA
jgi:NADH dehydrogenase/NADH:ubiquinone oxidoreductase subunit G